MAGHQGSSTRGHFVEALDAAGDAQRRDMLTMIRGKVVSYDTATQKGTVKPLLKMKVGDTEIEAPDLVEVPFRQPRGGGFAIHAPVQAGDEVDLHFSSRALDPAQADGSSQSGAPGRMNQISDAVAYPSGSNDKTAMKDIPSDRMHVGTDNGKSGLQVTKAGKVDVKGTGEGGDESLLDIWKEMLTLFKQHTHNGVAMDPQWQEAAENLKSRITAIQAD